MFFSSRGQYTALSGLLLATPVFAASTLKPVVITATRSAQTVDETLAPVTVITRGDIRRAQARSVQDVLSARTGISLANNGGAGKTTSIFLRGAESDHVLVLVDGIKINSATTGGASLQNIPISQVEKIEVVRGPYSSLYGSEAIGGVIQIFTKKGGGAVAPHFSIGAGSFNSYEATAGLSGGSKNLWYNLNLSYEDTEGFDACQANLTAGCFADEPDSDGFDNTSSTFRIGSKFSDLGEWDLHVLHAEGTNEFDGSVLSGNESDIVEEVIGGSIRFSPLETLMLNVKAGQSKDESELFFNGEPNSHFNTKRQSISLQADLSAGKAALFTLGVDYDNDEVDSSTEYEETSRNNKGFFAQYLNTFRSVDLQLSLRNDDNEQFGNHSTGNFSIGHVHSNGWRVTVSAGTAYKAPTFNELYFPGFGNKALNPETSVSYELGISNGASNTTHWTVNVFQTNIKDLIAFDATTFSIGNIEKAKIQGIESELGTTVGHWEINANLNLLAPENDGNSTNKGNTLPRRAKQSLRLDIDRRVGKLGLGSTLIATGSRYDNLDNSQEIGGYTTVDLHANYAFHPDWLIQARLGNLLDKDYETAKFYNQPERNLFVTLRYQPTN